MQLVDLIWQSRGESLIHTRFPHTDLALAKRYAYGGALLSDAGYYPRAVPYISDFTHYIRSGDFITNLFLNATDGYELAFAIGALAHYVGDVEGHSLATNPSVAIAFASKFAPARVVLYYTDTTAHREVETGFDVNALNKHRLAPKKLVDQVRIDVALQQLTYAFYQTYGLRQDFTQKGSSLNVYRYRNSAKTLLPSGIYAIAKAHKDDVPTEDTANSDVQELTTLVDRVAAVDQWNSFGYGGGALSGFIKVILAVVPRAKVAQVKVPDAVTQRKYIHSLLFSLHTVERILDRADVSSDRFIPLWPDGLLAQNLPNFNLDSGSVDGPTVYPLTDHAYLDLLDRIISFHRKHVDWPLPLGLRADITHYLPSADASFRDSFLLRNPQIGADLLDHELEELKGIQEKIGCPDTSFGKADTGWRDPNPPSPIVPALCDPR